MPSGEPVGNQEAGPMGNSAALLCSAPHRRSRRSTAVYTEAWLATAREGGAATELERGALLECARNGKGVGPPSTDPVERADELLLAQRYMLDLRLLGSSRTIQRSAAELFAWR